MTKRHLLVIRADIRSCTNVPKIIFLMPQVDTGLTEPLILNSEVVMVFELSEFDNDVNF